MIRLGVAQIEPLVLELDKNIARTREVLNKSLKNDIDVLVLPELANSGYVFETMAEAEASSESIPRGDYSKLLREWSTSGGLVVAGVCENYKGVLYNSAAVFGNGKHLMTYRKIHLFGKERNWFSPGDEEPPVVAHQGHRYGIMICFDWAFPETARILALNGAQVILHPANLVTQYCQKAMVTRSIENGVFTATGNRIGKERKVTFRGRSQITNHRGKVLLKLNSKETGVAYVDIDPTEADDKHLTKWNDLFVDRRTELYNRLVE
jgi:predicted amidohydrolase